MVISTVLSISVLVVTEPVSKIDLMSVVMLVATPVLFTIFVVKEVLVVPVLYMLYPSSFNRVVTSVKFLLIPLAFNISIFISELFVLSSVDSKESSTSKFVNNSSINSAVSYSSYTKNHNPVSAGILADSPGSVAVSRLSVLNSTKYGI